MIRTISFCLFIGLLSILTSCDKSHTKDRELPAYHSCVEAFSFGNISRYSPVYLMFNSDIPKEMMKPSRLDKLMRIEPKVKGKWAFENAHTVVFKPEKEFDRNTTYRVTADVSEWFDVKGDERQFRFSVSTLPLALRANWVAMDVNPKNENGFDITAEIFTPDKERPETVEELVAFSEKVDARWQHDRGGKRHELVLRNVAAGSEEERVLRLSVAANKWNVKKDVLLQMDIPYQNDLSVYDIRYVSEPERYIEVAFTKTLDPEQEMRGLAFIADNTSDLVKVEGNKLRLYPDANLRNRREVNVHLNEGIRSKSGLNLEGSVVRQVTIEELKPNVRFVGDGVIIPQSSELSVPFQAIYLRGVTVSVIKIMEQNIGQFLQANNLDDSDELMRVGRLIARKTIFLDEEGLDLSRWNTFAIDMKQLIAPEPGAIYRLELSFDRKLSAYPCDKDTLRLTKAEILAQDEVRFKEEVARFDEGGYYYFQQNDWSHFDWRKRDDPCADEYYFNKVVGKNVLATNLGLVAKRGENGEMNVWVHNLLDVRPERGVKVNVYNYQHQVVASGETDSRGQVKLDVSESRPFYLIASLGNQRSYLRVDPGLALSLSSFDVSGEVVQKGIKGFIYGERGVWRPGDTLHIGFMLNDRTHQFPKRHPVVMELYNPLGQLYARKTEKKGELGIYTFAFATENDAPTGAWHLKAQVGGVTFTKRVRIESIKPNRLKVDLSVPRTTLLRGESLNAKLHVEWLQGAIARHLKYDIKGTFISTPTVFEAYKDFEFDDPARVFNTEETPLIAGKTDERGNARVDAKFELGTRAPGMLLGSLVTRAFEESGEFSVNANRILYSPYQRYVGIRSPQKDKSPLQTGKTYSYDVASVSYDGKPAPKADLEVKIYKVEWHWWWNANTSGLANYVSDSYRKPVKTFQVKTNEEGKGRFQLSFPFEEWGTYFIAVKDVKGKHQTGVLSYFDWAGQEGRRDADGSASPTMLSFKIDKDSYEPGDEMVIHFPSNEGGRAIISIENGVKVLKVKTIDCKPNGTTAKVKVTKEMRPNAYVHITMLQPHGIQRNDMPIRMYGVVPFSVNSAKSHLCPVIHAPKEIKPETMYSVSVSEKDGRSMAYTLAIVDEGLLDLTRFRTPEPWQAFNAREALGVNTWDLYNLVVGSYGGRIERLFSIGGDEALNHGPKATVNRFKPVVKYVGPFLLKKGKTATHTFTMPNYNGRVRVMVVAGDGEAYGNAEKAVVVRKPVMLLGTLPRVIGVGEEMVVPATVFTTEDGVGDVKVSIRSSSNMEIIGEATKTLHFGAKGDQLAYFRMRVKDQPGVGKVTIVAEGKGEQSLHQTELEIRSVNRPQRLVKTATIAPGKTWNPSVVMPGVDGTNQLALEVSAIAPVNLGARLAELSKYPHDCLEQIISKAFPSVFVGQWMETSRKDVSVAEKRVKEIINRLRSYQTVDGGFAYWPGLTTSHAWGSAYAVHFMYEASKKGYLIPENMQRSARNYLMRVARNWKPIQTYYKDSEEITQAYRLFVLSLAQSPEMGAMNRMKEQKDLNETSRWLLAAAYAYVGRDDVANQLITQTTATDWKYTEYDQTFGDELRDQAIRLQTLTLLNKSDEAARYANDISKRLASDEWYSTQTIAYSLIALSDYLVKYPTDGTMAFAYACDKRKEIVETERSVWSETLMRKAGTSAKMEVTNNGKSTLYARVVTEGIPTQGKEVAYANGISLAVSYVDLNGAPVQVEQLEQGANFTAVVTVRNASSRGYNHLVLSEFFPAGWEILNTRYLSTVVKDSTALGMSYQDIRDDRVHSYIDRLPAGKQLTIKINLCAVYPGRFYLPPVSCEAMYDRLVRANTTGREVEVIK